MKISYNQLKQYINLDISPEETSELLTDIGLEVEHTTTIGISPKKLEQLTVGEILSCEKHPNADRLKIVTVNIGNNNPITIVCGASNVAENQKVVVALPNTTLYPINAQPITIKKSKIRGIESSGMICAEDEIGLGNQHEGIIVLNESAEAGKAITDYLNVNNDTIFEIGLTANRSDATGHIGVARDLAAALSIRKNKTYNLIYPETPDLQLPLAKNKIEVEVLEPLLCTRYTGILLENITVQPSPIWLQNFLTSVGFKAINNIVDITNFVLLEYGQPLHAFDADKIKGEKIIVKKLTAALDFSGLDNTLHPITSEDLMICDTEKPLCIAGVFGGKNSGVSTSTKNIFIESACFNSISVRKTASRLNLHTDAAQRYEKGTDPKFTHPALLRAVSLLKKYAQSTSASEIIDIQSNTPTFYPVFLPYEKINKISGIHFEKNIITRILTHLEIKIDAETQDGWQLHVPLFKADVQRDIDVIEEIMRIYGYNKVPIPQHFTILPQNFNTHLSFYHVKEKIADYLANNGFHQIINNSIVSNQYENYGFDTKNAVHLLKSAQSELSLLRSDMLISGLETIKHNVNRKQNDLKLFEIGKIYSQTDNSTKYVEQEHLALFATGNQKSPHWQQKNIPVDLFFMKGITEQIFKLLKIDNSKIEATTSPTLKHAFTLSYQQKKYALIGEVNTKLLQKMEIDTPVFYANLNLEQFLFTDEKQNIIFQEIGKFPVVKRDMALLLHKDITYQQIKEIAVNEGGTLLKDISLFDIYVDKKLGDDKKSYAVSFWFENKLKTLVDSEVDEIINQLGEKYKNILGAEIR